MFNQNETEKARLNMREEAELVRLVEKGIDGVRLQVSRLRMLAADLVLLLVTRFSVRRRRRGKNLKNTVYIPSVP